MNHANAKRRLAASRYILGELPALERMNFEEHYFDCEECAQDIRALLAISYNSPAVLTEDLLPLKTGRAADEPKRANWLEAFWSWRPRAAFALAPACAVMLFAFFTAYQSARLRKQLAPQTVAAFNLLPDARGAETVIRADRQSAFLVLTADVPEIAQAWKWQIQRSGSGAGVLEGTAAATSGGSFTLLLPVSALKPGSYVLTLRDAAGPSLAPAEARFGFRMQ
jgi:anti-sigma factor RsiW